MTNKTAEELAKERAQAQAELDRMLDKTRPRNLAEGVGSGISNIVSGAVGGAGVAVMMPTLGLAAGMRGGGLVGGVVGVTGGAVVGILGGAAMAVGGALSGVMQIGRGVAAIPESIMAPRQGKWWNENQGKWIKTDMNEECNALDGVPEDDKDILGKVQDDIDKSIRDLKTTSNDEEVVDMYYYDALEVPASADASQIKRKYYVLARKYHPDKVGKEDKEAADKFKEIAEAYQVLSDPELRERYDKVGRDGLSADKTETANGMPNVDPALLFAFLFGSDKFYPYVGRLSTATSASVGDSPKITMEDAVKLQHRRVTRMAKNLIDKITPWVEESKGNGPKADIESRWTREAAELAEASFGHQMVTTIGKIYNLLAVSYEGSMDSGQGLPSLSAWASKQSASMDKKKGEQENQIEAMRAGLDMMKLQAEYKEKLEKATTAEEEEQIKKQMHENSVAVMVRILWTTAVVDITAALYEATQMTFFDASVDKETRKHRAKAVKKLGEVWMNTPKPTTKPEDAAEKNIAQLYEEAAFAAMVETVKRKDDAAHSSFFKKN